MHSAFDRIAAGGGIAFAVLAVATMTIAPAAPAVDAPAGEIRRYLTDHHDRFGLSAIAMALAVLAVALSFSYIHRRLADTDKTTALPACFLATGAATVTLALAGVLLQGVLAQHAVSGIDDSTLLALHRTWNIVAFTGPPLPLAIALLLAGVRTIQRGLFPRWLGWIAVVSALGGAVTALINLGTSTQAPAVLDFGSFLLSCLFLAGVSVHAFLRGRTDPEDRPISRPAATAARP